MLKKWIVVVCDSQLRNLDFILLAVGNKRLLSQIRTVLWKTPLAVVWGNSLEKGGTKGRDKIKSSQAPEFQISTNPLCFKDQCRDNQHLRGQQREGDWDKTMSEEILRMDCLFHTLQVEMFLIFRLNISLWSWDSSSHPLNQEYSFLMAEEATCSSRRPKEDKQALPPKPKLGHTWSPKASQPWLLYSGSIHPAMTYSHCHNIERLPCVLGDEIIKPVFFRERMRPRRKRLLH